MKLEELELYVSDKKPAYNFKDLTGTETEYFKIISRAPNSKSGRVRWNCQCKSCGEYCVKDRTNLNKHKSCGCNKNKSIGKALRKNLINQQFGLLTAIEDTGKSNPAGNVIWKCKCQCGNIIEVPSNNLTSNHTQSCGCINYSIGAQSIVMLLKNNNINFLMEYPIKVKEGQEKPYRFDFAIIDDSQTVIRFIEYDGEQHYKDTWSSWKNEKDNLLMRQYRDQLKNEYAKLHNIPLVRIPYWKRDNITLDMIFGDKYLI